MSYNPFKTKKNTFNQINDDLSKNNPFKIQTDAALDINNPFKIQTNDGKTIIIELDPNETINEVKRKVYEKEGILPEEQRLIFRDQAIEGTLAQLHNNQMLIEEITLAEILQQQDEIIIQQDIALEELSRSISRIRVIGQDMNTELHSQNDFLLRLNSNINATNLNLHEANREVKKINHNLKKNRCMIQ